MAARTAAQEEFDSLFTSKSTGAVHPEDRDHDEVNSDIDEETQHAQDQVEAAMHMPVFDSALHLPSSFDRESRTGVKGVIADARSYEEARRQSHVKSKPISSKINKSTDQRTLLNKTWDEDELDLDELEEDDEFLEQWRESRRAEIVVGSNDIRSQRRTSPSLRRYGTFDEVDMLGYLDAIEKVSPDTIVVVFVYDDECQVSAIIEEALLPLIRSNPTVHFVKVHYEQIEFDNAGVPAVLGYRQQGDLFANLTYIIDQIPDDTLFDTDALSEVLKRFNILP